MALKVVTEAVNSLSKANSSGSETTMLGQQHVPRWSCFLVDTSKSDKGVLLSLPSVESSFMQLCIPGIRSFADDDIAPLTVAIECLTTLEGPFWKRIRGLGLSYSYAIRSSPEEGLINFVLFKSGSPIAAFEEARSIVSESLAGQACFSDVALQSAKAAVVFSTMAREENQDSAATVRLLSYYRKESIESATQEFLRRIQLVTVGDVLRVTKRWIMPLFQHNKDARFALVTGPTKVADVLPKMSTCFLHHVRVETDPLTLNLL
jgi:Zn-dependent M16 (insulinase) family peptidase